jgi:hypothetical protein
MVVNNSILAHYDAGFKREETISSSYDRNIASEWSARHRTLILLISLFNA